MELHQCLHPIRVFNKYLGEFVWTSCGNCEACKHRHALRWVYRLKDEQRFHKYCFFVTLTYSDKFLPKLIPNVSFDDKQYLTGIFKKDCEFVSNRNDEYFMPFSDFEFTTKSDLSLFHGIWHAKLGIPYASKRDIQLFHKRLNKFFYDNVTSKFKNFRFFVVSEFGSTTCRPHMHGIYFVDDERVAKEFEKGICSCWKFGNEQIGRFDCQSVESSAISYVAQYINSLSDLPSFYAKGKIKPWFLCSRNPAIGVMQSTSEDLRKIFDSGTVSQVVHKQGTSKFVDVPLQQSFENRLYPRCSFFNKISDSLRIKLYTITGRFDGKKFQQFYFNVINYLKYNDCNLAQYLRYLATTCNCFYDSLRRLYFLSRRFMKNCYLFGLSPLEYLKRIVKYYQDKALYRLKRFYRLQEEFCNDRSNDPEDLVQLYSDFAMRNSDIVTPLEETRSFRNFVKDTHSNHVNSTKTHYKNIYKESICVEDVVMFNLLKLWYYAQKCNETLEAFASPQSERLRFVASPCL